MEDDEDPFAEDVKAFHRVVGIAIDELKDAALGANIERRHHLESAVDCFVDIGKLIDADKIISDLFDLEEPDAPPASQVESSDVAYDTSHHTRRTILDALRRRQS